MSAGSVYSGVDFCKRLCGVSVIRRWVCNWHFPCFSCMVVLIALEQKDFLIFVMVLYACIYVGPCNLVTFIRLSDWLYGCPCPLCLCCSLVLLVYYVPNLARLVDRIQWSVHVWSSDIFHVEHHVSD